MADILPGRLGYWFEATVATVVKHRRFFEDMNAPIARDVGTNRLVLILNDTQLKSAFQHVGFMREDIGEDGRSTKERVQGSCEGCTP